MIESVNGKSKFTDGKGSLGTLNIRIYPLHRRENFMLDS